MSPRRDPTQGDRQDREAIADAPEWARALDKKITSFLRVYETLRAEGFLRYEINVAGDLVMGDKGGDTNIHGNVGALAQTGALQVIGSITQNITALQSNPETQQAAEGFKQLSEAIQKSSEIPSERERKRYLEDIEELTAQAAKSKPQREKGVVGPITDRLAALCGAAGGLATVWQVAGPSILALFA
jgi:hypothetical protein